jgi:hypothetical protein
MVTSKKADRTREDDKRCELVDQLPQRARERIKWQRMT